MNRKYFIFLSVVLLAFLGSCSIYNPSEPIPSYIHIENLGVSVADQSVQGTTSSKICDAWIYIDEQLIGCFEMPCTVPVLWDGTHTLKIRPGIKVNGIAATRAPYPFYDNYTQVITLQRGATTNITGATVKYLNNMTFKWLENFDGNTVTLDTNSHLSESGLIFLHNPPASTNIYEGTGSAVAYLKSSQQIFECFSHNRMPMTNRDAFLEINYKCNHEFTVKLAGYTVSGTIETNYIPPIEVLTLNASANWNKAYLYLSPTIKQLIASGAQPTEFRVFFDMYNFSGTDSVGMAIDNIKVIQ